MFIRSAMLVCGLALAGTGTALADAHKVTYVKNTAALGSTVTLDGQDFKIVRMPFRLFTGEKYSIILPAPILAPGFGSVTVNTTHIGATEAFPSNLTIDTFPARVSVVDSRSYDLTGNIGTAATLTVQAGVIISIQIKVSTTVVTLSYFMVRPDEETGEGPNETEADVGNAVNVLAFAQWPEYRDPITEIKAVNDLVDYIRILAI